MLPASYLHPLPVLSPPFTSNKRKHTSTSSLAHFKPNTFDFSTLPLISIQSINFNFNVEFDLHATTFEKRWQSKFGTIFYNIIHDS